MSEEPSSRTPEEIAADVARTLAETKKIEAETKKAEAEALVEEINARAEFRKREREKFIFSQQIITKTKLSG